MTVRRGPVYGRQVMSQVLEMSDGGSNKIPRTEGGRTIAEMYGRSQAKLERWTNSVFKRYSMRRVEG